MGVMTGKERRRLETVYRRNRALWMQGELPVAELFYQRLFDSAVLRSGLAVPPLYPVGSAANASLLYVLFRLIDEFRGLNGLELGAGQSSLLLDALARAGRLGSMTTLEHDADWAGRIGSKVAHEVVVAPLRPARVQGIATEVYEFAPQRRFDLIFVDGPVGMPEHSRWGALALLETHLADEFVVVFDDAERPGERQTIEQFLRLRPTAGHAFVHAMKSQCLVFTPKYRALASY